MTEVLTAAEMRAIEETAIASGEVTGLELMERAGRGVVEAVFEEWPELAAAPSRAAILCGPGNNGGDGFVVARLLKERGWEVALYLFGDPEKLPPDARTNHDRWTVMGAVKPYVDEGPDAFRLAPPDGGPQTLIVDALFGTGLTRPVERFDAFGWATQVSHSRIDGVPVGGDAYPHSRVVAVDMPSGVCSDSGRYLRPQQPGRHHEDIRADLTVSFHARKRGHLLAEGPAACGKVVVKDIGLRGSSGEAASLVDARRAWRGKSFSQHKYAHGHALILSGGPGRGGAARLAARGALRIGAGLVTVACPQPALWENAAQLDAIMLRGIDGAPGLRELLEDERMNAVGLGPGLGTGADTQQLVLTVLEAGRAAVLDADALTRFERNPEVLFDALHEACVLTPHAGEFGRLFPDIAEKLGAPATEGPAYSKVDAAREAAARAGCTMLFKGADTVIADPTGRCSINSAHYERAAPWLATGGAGDVLTGFITGLLARGFSPMAAAGTAAWLHVECALSFGPGLIAEDIPEELPRVFRRFGF